MEFKFFILDRALQQKLLLCIAVRVMWNKYESPSNIERMCVAASDESSRQCIRQIRISPTLIRFGTVAYCDTKQIQKRSHLDTSTSQVCEIRFMLFVCRCSKRQQCFRSGSEIFEKNAICIRVDVIPDLRIVPFLSRTITAGMPVTLPLFWPGSH